MYNSQRFFSSFPTFVFRAKKKKKCFIAWCEKKYFEFYSDVPVVPFLRLKKGK